MVCKMATSCYGRISERKSRYIRNIGGSSDANKQTLENGSTAEPLKAPPDERGGNRHAQPNVTAPHLDFTDLQPSAVRK